MSQRENQPHGRLNHVLFAVNRTEPPHTSCVTQQSPPSYIPSRSECVVHSPRDPHKNVQSSTTSESPALETTQMPIKSRWISKVWCGHTMEYYTAKESEVLLQASAQMNPTHVLWGESSHIQNNTHCAISTICGVKTGTTHGLD